MRATAKCRASSVAKRRNAAQRGLTPKQEQSVHEYLIDLNATQAAIRAGYSPKTATSQGSRLLRNVHVATLIEQGRLEAAGRAKLKLDDIIEEIRKVAFANMADYTRLLGDQLVPDFSVATRNQIAAVSNIEVTEEIVNGSEPVADGEVSPRTVLRRRLRFGLHDKLGALLNLEKYHRGFGATLNINDHTSVEFKLAREELRALPEAALDAIIDGVAKAAETEPDEDER